MIKLYKFGVDYYTNIPKNGEKLIVAGGYHHQTILIKIGRDIRFYEIWNGKIFQR